jgi:hypothetical protein
MCCVKCGRPMVWRRLWNQIPKDIRDHGIIVRRHNATLCQTHYIQEFRRSRMTDTEWQESLSRLREHVGFNPNKDYEAEDEAMDNVG